MISLAAAALAFEANAASGDAPAIARAFLQVLAAEPSAAVKFVTDDASVLMGHATGPYSENMREVRPRAMWLNTCRVGTVQQKPKSTLDGSSGRGRPPSPKGENMALVEAAYHCTNEDGSKFEIKATVILRNDKVMLLGFEGPD